MNKGLLDERPIVFLPTLAERFAKIRGLSSADAAIIIQQLHYWMETAREANNQYVHIDGKWWVYNSYPQWAEQFIWLSVPTIQRIFSRLEKLGLIESRQGVKDKTDRRKWYTINYDALDMFLSCPSYQVDTMDDSKLIRSNLSETTSESTSFRTSKEVRASTDAEDKKLSIQPIEDTTPAPITEPTEHQAIIGIIEAWLDATGTIDSKAYAKTGYRDIALDMHKAGVTPALIREYVKWKREDKFWVAEAITLSKIASTIISWRDNRHIDPSHIPWTPPADPDDSLTEEELDAKYPHRHEVVASLEELALALSPPDMTGFEGVLDV